MRVCSRARCAGPPAILLFIIATCAEHVAAASSRSALKKSTATAHVFKPEDFIVVINTEQARLQLALASRPLRAGLRTFIAIDNITLAEELNKTGHKYNETYAYFPNRNVTGPERSKPGDTRWQAAPFMAHHHYGPSYKWMLLGDDDTLWFMMGVKRLLYGYDHDLPYAISDHFGDHNVRGFFLPSPLAAVCSPCHWPDLLRAHHREDLLPYSSAVLTRQEAASWEPRELDGWGTVRRKPRNRAADDGGAGGGGGGGARSTLEAPGGGRDGDSGGNGSVAAAADAAGRKRPWRAAWARRWRAVKEGSGGGNGTLPLPAWGKKAQEQVNMSAALEAAYYGAVAHTLTAGGGDARDAAGAAAAAAAAVAPPPPIPPPGCPCRPAQGCLHRARLCRGRGRGQELCGRALVYKVAFRGNRSWCGYSWAHGGAGVVLSVGLLRATAGGPVEACARVMQVHSCDMNLAMCLMNPGLGQGLGAGAGAEGGSDSGEGSATEEGSGRSARGDDEADRSGSGSGGGFMFTHPGNAALRGANWADPRFMLFDNPVFQRVLHDPVGFLEGRVVCDRGAVAAATAAAAALALRAGTEVEAADGEEAQGAGTLAVAEGEGGGVGEPGAVSAVEGGSSGRRLREATGAGGGDDAAGGGRPAGGKVGGAAGGRRRDGELDVKDDGAICEWLVRHAVSLHMHGRSYTSYDEATKAMAAVVRQHMLAVRRMRELQQ